MTKQGDLLVPVDFSEHSLIVLDQAVFTAKVIKANVSLLHVIETYSSNSLIDTSNIDKKDREDSIEKAVADKFKEIIRKYDNSVSFKIIIKKGKIYKQIIETAEEINARAIIMGTHGASGFQKYMLGTNALRTVRAAKCPVITMNQDTMNNEFKNFILPLDLTKETKEKVRIAIETAQQFGSTIHIVSVSQTNDEFIVNRLKRQLAQVKGFIKDAKIPHTAKLIKGSNIAKSILDYAENIKADLIIIMTQQEADFVELMIGTSAQQIVNTAVIPVLSIRPIERKDTTRFVPEMGF